MPILHIYEMIHNVIHAYITSRLDYCNSLYIGASQLAISRLQLVQNAAARAADRNQEVRRHNACALLPPLAACPIQDTIQNPHFHLQIPQ